MEELKISKADKSVYESDYRHLRDKLTDLTTRFNIVEKASMSSEENILKNINLSIDCRLLECL